jgi:DNA polymerase-3 subunit delta'
LRFTDIPGSPQIKEKLIQAVRNGKVAHAQLFVGTHGALNLPLALAYTTYLHCQNKGESDSCGSCAACSKSLKYIHPDTHFVFPIANLKGDKDEDRYKADMLKTWRSFLTEQPFGNLSDWAAFHGGEDKLVNISREESRSIIKSLSLKPFESPHKIMIIWQPEFMHPTAANGILKILEEPPPHTFFLLVTNSAEQLLATILSRTQAVRVPLLTDKELDAYLHRYPDLEEPKRQKIVQHAEGDLNLALALLETGEDSTPEQFSDWMRACFKKDYGKLVRLAEDFHGSDRLSQGNLLQYGLTMMRETLLHRAGATTMARSRGAEQKFAADFSAVMDVMKIEKTSTLMNEAAFHLDRNGSAKMIFLDLSIQISSIINP